MIKECKIHGLTEFALRENGKRWRCKKCALEFVKRRRANLKLKAVEYKGGKCAFCGYKNCINALEFHHFNPLVKEFGIAYKGYTRSWKKLKNELDKCILVCSNCHREIHEDITHHSSEV